MYSITLPAFMQEQQAFPYKAGANDLDLPRSVQYA